MLVQDRASSRRFFCVSWEKYRQGDPVEGGARPAIYPTIEAYLDCLGRM